MQLLHSSYHWQMKAMRVVPMKTYQHLYIKCHAITMYPAWNMHPLILHIPHNADQSQQPTILYTHLPDQCTAIFPSVVTTISTPPQYAWTLQIAPVIQHQTPLIMRYHHMRMRISPTVPMDDEYWSMEMVPERTFCIHENGLPNNVCSYPCPYGYNGTPSYIDS